MSEYCSTCKRVTETRIEDGPSCTKYLCAECGNVVDMEFEDCDGGDGSIDDPHRTRCHYCGGDGWGIIGCDWDSDDPINGPYVGQAQRCPCCHGSGLAKDESFW